ncbi:MAG: Lrp/AsnC ligand binding domain-containing protein, partial [Dehalococcoidia bacterium]|nr:Lrp/AsnC ligand binding domain-containing protein [Dehalococcoidia bacterium]
DLVTGPYDIITVVEHDDFNAIGGLVTERIHPIPGIKRTVTCLSIRVS